MSLTFILFKQRLHQKYYTKISILIGAGISTAAGLRDYRSKNTGLYDVIKKYNLSNPEQVYDINVFRKNPQLYYSVCREYGTHNIDLQPTEAHNFIKKLQDRNQLLNCFTQNIDGLELKAGLQEDLLIQVHGHRRTASCIDCQLTYSIKEFYQNVDNNIIMKCNECNGLIKPNVIFFGQKLPQKFFEKQEEIQKSDLVIVMGTSLQVQPFANLLFRVPIEIPIVLINNDINLKRLDQLKNEKLLIQGDIQEIIKSIQL